MICGGIVTLAYAYLDPSTYMMDVKEKIGFKEDESRVYVFGGGHVGKEVVDLLAHVGFKVVLIDNRAEFASKERHPRAEKTIVGDYSNISRDVTINNEDYVVIMTHGHVGDRDVLLQACKTGATYIGCIGSKRKIAMTQSFLRENGIKEDVIKAIHSPIGIELYGDSPEEIAVSVAAELIRHRAMLSKGIKEEL